MLSTTSEHALRALTQLAGLPDGASMLGREIAERTGIPANYLSKILWTLGHAGIIGATRGNGGGYRLKRTAAEIRLFEVVELFEGERVKSDPDDACAAQEAWRVARTAYLEYLRSTTLADISELRHKK